MQAQDGTEGFAYRMSPVIMVLFMGYIKLSFFFSSSTFYKVFKPYFKTDEWAVFEGDGSTWIVSSFVELPATRLCQVTTTSRTKRPFQTLHVLNESAALSDQRTNKQ